MTLLLSSLIKFISTIVLLFDNFTLNEYATEHIIYIKIIICFIKSLYKNVVIKFFNKN